jgi:DNA-binding transcriptional LysR family regulator
MKRMSTSAERKAPGQTLSTVFGTAHVALGHGLALVPATAAAYYQRPDITYRPVTGAPPYQVALATTPDTAKRPEAQAFVKTALAVSARHAADRGDMPL